MSLYNLPQINKVRQERNKLKDALRSHICQSIVKFEIDHDCCFDFFEVDNILLEIVKDRHEKYIEAKYGTLIID